MRTLLVVLSIAVGVFAVGATTGLADQMLPTMDSSHQATMPSHVTMYLDQPASLEDILALRRLPGVEEVEALNTIEVRYKLTPQEEWHKANIWMREDYQHQTYDVVQLKAGEWPEGRVLGIERMHSPFYGIDIGDQVILEIDGKPRSFPVTGIIRHPFVPPPMMYDITWFFGDAQVMEMFGIPPGQFTQLRFRVSPFSPEYARLVASTVKERLAHQHINVTSSVYQDPQKHWGRSFVAGMALVMQVLAIVSMLLSVVLVLNTITALITQQTNQIGIMKAIGGTNFTLTRAYLAGVLVYGLLSLSIALPLGIISSFSITRWFLGIYNVEYESFAFSQRAIIYMILAALAVPLTAALVPIMNGARMTVRQAIASYGLGGDFGSSWIDRLVERIGRRFLASYNAIALANTFRRKGRLVLTELVLVTAGVMFLMVMSLGSSITATLDAEFDRNTHDIIFYLEEYQRVDRTTALAEQVDGVQKAEMWLVVPVTILREGHKSMDAGMGSALYGMPLDDPMYVPLVVEGRWLETGDDRAVVLNKQTADDEHIGLGDTISLDMGQWGQADWKVVGLYRVFLMFGGGFSVNAIYAPRPAVSAVTKKTGKASTLLVRTSSHSSEAVDTSLRGLEESFELRNIDVAQTETIPALRRTYDTSFSYVTSMLMVLAVITAVVGGIGLMGSLWIGVIERTKEIGILRSIGARSSHILNMFVLEAIIQGLMSWLIAVPLSLLVTPWMADALGQAMFQNRLDYQYSFTGMLIWLAIVLVISILASAIPARKASQVNIRQSLSYE